MRKTILIWVIALIALGIFVQAACDDYDKCSTQSDRAAWLEDRMGIKISGENFIYNKDTNSLTITQGSSAEIPVYFPGKVRVVDATVNIKDNEITFTGKGTYSKLDGFSVENGKFNGLVLENSNGVKYNKYSGEISGVAGDNCRVLEQKVGKNTKFFYDEKTNTIRFEGDSKTTTLPGVDIVFDGKGYKYGKSYIDLQNSKLYVLPQQEPTTFDGIKLKAENRPVRFSFVEDDLGYALIPVRNFVVLSTDTSISDVFKKAGYGSNNFEARREFYENVFNDKYTGSASQNIDLFNALKNGDAELQYKDSNVQIRAPNDKVKQTLPTAAKPESDVDYGKLDERVVRVDKKNDPLEKTILSNGKSIGSNIEELVKENNADPKRAKVDVNVVKGNVLTESGAKLNAENIGRRGMVSTGLMMLTDDAVRQVNSVYGTDYNLVDYKNDPITNLRVGIAYLSYLSSRCNGNVECTISANNIGETTGVNYFNGVDAVVINGKTIHINGVKGEIHPATKAHVAKVLAASYKYGKSSK